MAHSKSSRVTGAGLLAGAIFMGVATHAQASIVISAMPTTNMSCSKGVCSATAASAVLNVTDLRNYLAAGNLTVTSVSQSTDIDVTTGVPWNAHALTLDSFHAIFVTAVIADERSGGLVLRTNHGGKGGTLSFGLKGRVYFARTSDSLRINGRSYVLANTIAALASAVAINPAGNFALTTNYDASSDGTYSSAPINTSFTGNFNGLGNTIANLSINDATSAASVGLFSNISGAVANLRLTNVKISGTGNNAFVGGLAGYSQGTISFVSVSGGSVTAGPNAFVGGLVGQNNGILIVDFSSAAVIGGDGTYGGGLAGPNTGTISLSAATQTASVTIGANGYGGGLIGANFGVVTNTFAWGPVSVGDNSYGGGFVGDNYTTGGTSGTIIASYSAGKVTGTSSSFVGGFAGYNNVAGPSAPMPNPGTTVTKGAIADSTTDGQTNLTGPGSDHGGITSKTTRQLDQGLPAMYSDNLWVEDDLPDDPFSLILYLFVGAE